MSDSPHLFNCMRCFWTIENSPWHCRFEMTFLKLCYHLLAPTIHRMQIWRTARLAPRTSQMTARLVRLWCFILTMLFQKSLASLSIWSLFCVLPPCFCVPECHRNRVESSTAEKVLFFQFQRSPLRGNQRDGGKEFTIAEGTAKVRVGIDLRKCVSDCI